MIIKTIIIKYGVKIVVNIYLIQQDISEVECTSETNKNNQPNQQNNFSLVTAELPFDAK